MQIWSAAAEGIFSSQTVRENAAASLAQGALSRGADRYLNDDVDGAIREWKRALGLGRSRESVVQAHTLLATAYLSQEKTDEAIAAYGAAIAAAPDDDGLRLKLGNVYVGRRDYAAAEAQYRAAVRINPQSAENLLSLGQARLAQGDAVEAERAFRQVVRLAPSHHGGSYALGQAYAQQGRRREAIAEFERTLELKRDFYDAYVDLGYAYADEGDLDRAREYARLLEENDPNLAFLLNEHIEILSKPKIERAFSIEGIESFGPGTKLSSLESLGADGEFTMVFQFDKDMDPAAAGSPFNWRIGRAPSTAPGGPYNWGLPIAESEVALPPFASSVEYSADIRTAIVKFRLAQNLQSNGTLDPSHITFTFTGTDSSGNAMDPAADQYNGVSLIA